MPFRQNFNPRSPHGERRQQPARASQQPAISTHAPRTGSDLSPGTGGPHEAISTHAPRTGSDLLFRALRRAHIVISTHAPRTGSDKDRRTRAALRINFNPRSPHGERPHKPGGGAATTRFQPTLPARGATCTAPGHPRGGDISTHAPRTGSDRTATHKRRRERFQPTLPARGATVFHALLEETLGDFNPRSPHGERPLPRVSRRRRFSFQPTLPARGATRVHRPCGRRGEISTHAPRTGSDCTPDAPFQRLDYFNPRSPHGERRVSASFVRSSQNISTHAPRTGSDEDSTLFLLFRQNFNPRSPHGERPKSSSNASARLRFQPTLPARGATSRDR